jgi:hypothetical protein
MIRSFSDAGDDERPGDDVRFRPVTLRPAALVPALFAVACSRPLPPTIAAERATVTRVDATGIALDVELAATNPNEADLSVRELSAHLVLAGDRDVGTVTVPDAVTLGAGKTTPLAVEVTLKWSDLGMLAPLALTGADVPYSVDGTLSLGGMLRSVGVPFRLNGTIPRDQIIRATIPAIPGLTR